VDAANPAIRRLCIGVSFGWARARGASDRCAQTGELINVLDDACRDAPLDRALWHCQPQGDGELALLPPGVDEGYVIADFIREAGRVLYRHNQNIDQGSRLRLRIAFHQGITHIADSGYTGPAVAVICGLLDSQPLAHALIGNLSADLAVIVSQQIFEDVIQHDSYDLRAAEFVPVRIESPEENRTTAWIRIPGRELPPC